jgi:GNAT superfamily N-acetyltransferase
MLAEHFWKRYFKVYDTLNYLIPYQKLLQELEKELESSIKQKLHGEIDSLLTKCWGSFPPHFVEQHIFHSYKILVARAGRRHIGFCVMSIKNVLGVKIHYVEFLVVDPEYQKSGLGSHLFFVIIRKEIVRNLGQLLLGKPLGVFFITPNVRVLSRMAKFANYNPVYLSWELVAGKTGSFLRRIGELHSAP